MKIKITRMHGLGNRFAIIDLRPEITKNTKAMAIPQKLVAALEKNGGKPDQLLFLTKPEKKGDLKMVIFNQDGSQAEACGNGARCVGWMEMEARGVDQIMIETLGGMVGCRRNQPQTENHQTETEVDLGSPKIHWAEIPLDQERDTLHLLFPDLLKNMPKNMTENLSPENLGAGVAVNVGNPHIVFFPKQTERLTMAKLGAALEHHHFFPEGVNVSVVRIVPEGLRVKVWERGAGETSACGTAAAAAMVAAVRRFPVMPRAMPVLLPGGKLEVEWRKLDNHILTRGPVMLEAEMMINV